MDRGRELSGPTPAREPIRFASFGGWRLQPDPRTSSLSAFIVSWVFQISSAAVNHQVPDLRFFGSRSFRNLPFLTRGHRTSYVTGPKRPVAGCRRDPGSSA